MPGFPLVTGTITNVGQSDNLRQLDIYIVVRYIRKEPKPRAGPTGKGRKVRPGTKGPERSIAARRTEHFLLKVLSKVFLKAKKLLPLLLPKFPELQTDPQASAFCAEWPSHSVYRQRRKKGKGDVPRPGRPGYGNSG
jgi:hypothetical protein